MNAILGRAKLGSIVLASSEEGDPLQPNIEHSLDLTQQVEVNTILNRSLSDTLILQQNAVRTYIAAIESLLNLIHEVGRNLDETLTNTLDLQQILTNIRIHEEKAFSFLFLLEQSLNVALNGAYLASIFQQLSIFNFVLKEVIYAREFEHNLNLTDTLIRNIIKEIAFSDNLELEQEILLDDKHSQDIGVNQSLSAYVVRNNQVLNLTNIQQNVSVNSIFNRSIEQNLNLIGTIIPERVLSYFILRIPERVIILPRPIFSDSENLVGELTLRKSVNNVAYTTIRTVENHNLKLVLNLGRQKSLELYAFILLAQAQDIEMIDWKGKTRTVELITNPADFTASARFENEREKVDISLEFEEIK